MSPSPYKDTEFISKYGKANYGTLMLIVNLIQVGRTPNLNKLKLLMGCLLKSKSKETQVDSHYQRIIRFFKTHGDNPEFFIDVSRILARMLKKKGNRVLILDATQWELDNKNLHYITLSIVIQGVSIPILFTDLAKMGTSNQAERTEFMNQAILTLDLKGMTLIGDREYVGEKWFKALIDNGLNVIVRLKIKCYEAEYNDQSGSDYQKALKKCHQTQKISTKRIALLSIYYNLVMCPNRDKNAKDKVIFLISNLVGKRMVADLYLWRWKIEQMFKHLKTNGYNIEEINLKTQGRRSLLLLLTAIAYSLTIRAALDKYKEFKTITRKDGTIHLVKSVFQIGLSVMAKHSRTLDDFLIFIGEFFNLDDSILKQNV
jgi:hypothetical protein